MTKAMRVLKLEPIDLMALTLLGGVLNLEPCGAAVKKILYSLVVPNLPDGSFDYERFRSWARACTLSDSEMGCLTTPLRDRLA